MLPNSEEPPSLPPAEKTRSLVGETVAALIRARNVQMSEEIRLTNEIAALVEERRQRRKQITAMTAAITAIGQDPALSEDENEAVAENSQQYINSIDVGL